MDFVKKIKKDAFHFRVSMKTKVIPRNPKVTLEAIRLFREDDGEKISIDNPVYDYEVNSDFGAIIIDFWVVNDSEEEMERIDCLLDEDFEITKLVLKVTNGTTELTRYEILDDSYEQTIHKFEQDISTKCSAIADFFADYLVDEGEDPDEETIDKILSLVTCSESGNSKFADTLMNVCTSLM